MAPSVDHGAGARHSGTAEGGGRKIAAETLRAFLAPISGRNDEVCPCVRGRFSLCADDRRCRRHRCRRYRWCRHSGVFLHRAGRRQRLGLRPAMTCAYAGAARPVGRSGGGGPADCGTREPCGEGPPGCLIERLREVVCTASSREREVLGHIARGATYREIARRMDVSLHTVDTYVRRIRAKTGARNRTHLLLLASQGLLRGLHVCPREVPGTSRRAGREGPDRAERHERAGQGRSA